jgi:hypothetical protein
MRYLRMLSNSLIAGALASAYLTVLVLHLNPRFPLTAGTVVPLATLIWLAYGINLAVGFYALIVLRQIVAAEVLSPGWLSVRLLAWLCTAAASGGAALMWLNRLSFEPVLDPDIVARLSAAALMVSASAGVFFLIGLAHVGRRGGGASATVLVAAMLLSVAAPLGARGTARESPLAARPAAGMTSFEGARPDGRVTILMFDGASLDIISPAVAEGRLPNFGRILDAGAVSHLATLRPTQAEPVWAAVATGRGPLGNGVRASAVYRAGSTGPELTLLPDYCFSQALVTFGFLSEEPHTAASLQARPLWSILSDARVQVGVIGWPLTHPPPPVNGVLVSEAFHGITDANLDLEGPSALYPPELLPEIVHALRQPLSSDPVTLVATMTPAGDADPRPDPNPIVADRMHLQVLNAMDEHTPARFLAARFPGVDAVAHYFLRYANPAAFGDVSEQERRQYGRVLDEYYSFLDHIVGRVSDRLKPDDLLLVVSGFGMEPLSPGKRLLERIVGNPRLSGTHERAPDGFLLAFGAAVEPGRPARASVLDITPTVLYYLGLPVARDMEGFARTDLFRASFTASRPITFIPTYGR